MSTTRNLKKTDNVEPIPEIQYDTDGIGYYAFLSEKRAKNFMINYRRRVIRFYNHEDAHLIDLHQCKIKYLLYKNNPYCTRNTVEDMIREETKKERQRLESEGEPNQFRVYVISKDSTQMSDEVACQLWEEIYAQYKNPEIRHSKFNNHTGKTSKLEQQLERFQYDNPTPSLRKRKQGITYKDKSDSNDSDIESDHSSPKEPTSPPKLAENKHQLTTSILVSFFKKVQAEAKESPARPYETFLKDPDKGVITLLQAKTWHEYQDWMVRDGMFATKNTTASQPKNDRITNKRKKLFSP